MTSANASKPRIVVVCGPTGVGKTAVAIELAQALNGEIVGADSMQIYRYMDIGTAKPTPTEQAAVTHHMIDILDPDEPFDAARYAKQARRTIDTILERGRLAVVAGGTGFYIRALLGGLFKAGGSDPEVRRRLRRQAEDQGPEALHERLRACDPQTATALHPRDALRIVRALEVFEVTGRPLSEFQRAHGFDDCPYEALTFGLRMDRQRLYRRIERRVDFMVEAGLLQEVANLLARGYGPALKPMQSIGYRHMIDLIQGRCDRDTAIEAMKRDTRRYAKRQLTWFRRDEKIVWTEIDARNDLRRRVENFVENR